MSSDSDVAPVTEVMTVYMAMDGGLHHTRLGRIEAVRRARGGDPARRRAAGLSRL